MERKATDSIGNPLPTKDAGVVGILSRTIIPSTTIRWILPARIRHPEHNDVVFIGNNVVQIRELLPSQHLANIGARLDLDRRILAAKVISHVESTAFIDQVVKQGGYEINDPSSSQPTELLVLALDSSELAFVYVEELAPRRVKFRMARKKLPADASSLGKFGRHLAVDARSTTLAISTAYGHFGLLRVKSILELRDEIAAFDPAHPECFAPFKEERFVPVNGLILRMEFLVSSPEAGAKSALALLISRDEATDLHLYSWEENLPLRYAKQEGFGPRRLQDSDRVPLLMIPSRRTASFILVTESGLAVYDDVLSSRMQITRFQISQTFPSTFLSSRRAPLWVQWAKPSRHSKYLQTNDDFFLVREDGELELFEIKHGNPTRLETQCSVGSLKIGVDSAFAILQGARDQGGGDICVCGGDMTDGTVYHLKARQKEERIQTFANLAPIRDMLIVENDQANKPNRTFVCSGKGEGHAAVVEVRHGLEARRGFIAEQEDSHRTTGLWVLPVTDEDLVTLLISTPVQTRARQIDFKLSTIESADNHDAIQGLALDCQTLAFATTGESLLVQITRSAVTISSTRPDTNSVYKAHEHGPVLLAHISCDHRLFATVVMLDGEFRVLLSSIDRNGAAISVSDFCEADLKTDEPSSVLILNIGTLQILVVGTVAGWIHIFSVERGQRAQSLSQDSISNLFPEIEQSALCSLAFLTESTSGPPTIACGTRNGWLLALKILQERPTAHREEKYASVFAKVGLRAEDAQRIGQTSVELIPDSEFPSAALVFCGFQVYHLSSPQLDQMASLQLSRIWFTDFKQPGLEQPQISSVAALYRHISSGKPPVEAPFFCVSQSHLIISSLTLEPELVPRKMLLAGDPRKLAFAKGLGKLIVAIDQTKLATATSPRRADKRIIQPAIEFLDMGHSDPGPGKRKVVVVGKAGSRITSLLTLTPKIGNTRVQMIVIGLYIEGPDTAQCDGRLLYMKAKENSGNDSGLDVDIFLIMRTVGAPIYSISEFGPCSLIYCAGNELFLQTFDPSTGQWIRGPHFTLPTPAVSLHVDDRFVYATTARHSLMLLETDGNKFTLKATESRRRDAIRAAHQFAGTAEGGVLAATNNRGGRVLGLRKPNRGDFQLLFDAELPLSINCLRASVEGGLITQSGTRYYGSTQEGALYLFKVLDRKEWDFLDFIARLAWRGPVTSSRIRPNTSRDNRAGNKVQPTAMHINGDLIVELLRCGPDELRRLIEKEAGPDIQQQTSVAPGQRLSRLASLGEPLFGRSEDPILAASQWMRKLVRDWQ